MWSKFHTSQNTYVQAKKPEAALSEVTNIWNNGLLKYTGEQPVLDQKTGCETNT